MTELIGQTLGRYQMVERLGRGGMADVYKAYQPSLDRYVAIKVMHPHLADQVEFITRFKREAQAVAKLRHPNIIQVFDFDIQDDRYFMAMEYVEGSRTLKEVLADLNIKHEYLTLPQILNIISKAADALDFAHHQGMIHRDVKPSNILLPDLDTPLLSDFGIARLAGLTGLTATNMSIGTPAYMAPELGKGETASEQSDIYALGIVLYECLIGTPPYDADTPYGVILKHINDPLIPPHTLIKNLPDDVERIVLKSLAKKPKDRYASAALMRDALKAAAEQAEKNKVKLEIPLALPGKPQGAEEWFEAPTVVEEAVHPIAEKIRDSAASETLLEEKTVLPEPAESNSKAKPISVSEKAIKPRKKVKGWIWAVSALVFLGVVAGVFFLVDYLRTQAVLEVLPIERGYAICHLNGNCTNIEFSTSQFPDTFFFGNASWSPDASRFVFSACKAAQTCGLYISDLNGNVTTLVPSGGELNAMDPAWSPDGNTIAFHGNGELYITDLTGKLTLLASGTDINCPFGMAWSPDSQWIAWLGGTCAHNINYVWTINRDKTGYQENFYALSPELKGGMIAWTPDGKSIVFMSKVDTIYQVDVNCEAQKGCSTVSQSTLEIFPLTWLSNYTPPWHLDY